MANYTKKKNGRLSVPIDEKDQWKKIRREHFRREINHGYNVWKRLDPENNTSIEKFSEEFEVSVSSMKNYLSQGILPENDSPLYEYWEEVTGIPVECFDPENSGLRYGEISINKRIDDLNSYLKTIDLDPKFVDFITSIKDIWKYIPIHTNDFKSFELWESQYYSDVENMFQVNGRYEGKDSHYYLAEEDLDYLKSLSEEIEDFIKFKMIKEVNKAITDQRDRIIDDWRRMYDPEKDEIVFPIGREEIIERLEGSGYKIPEYDDWKKFNVYFDCYNDEDLSDRVVQIIKEISEEKDIWFQHADHYKLKYDREMGKDEK